MEKIKLIIKNEIVLILSFFLALASAFVVKPDIEYVNYIDFRTIALLFCLMAIMSALNNQGVFSFLAVSLLKRVGSTRALTAVFCTLCFFSSMLITNDVALITFVPFTILTLRVSDNLKPLPLLVILETLAANLGSMLTPIGNPQNLYLFSAFDMTMGDFVRTIYPYAVLSFVLIMISVLLVRNQSVKVQDIEHYRRNPHRLKCVIYAFLFLLAMLTVFRVIHFGVLLAVTVAVLLIADKRALLGVDYSLLFTFVFLFIFIGNLGRIDSVSSFLGTIIVGNEVPVGIAASQVFSNVPAAILLSGFSNNARDLLVGVNLGGLGTIIASMASLISFKFVAGTKAKKGPYLALFTMFNLAFLGANILLWLILDA